MTEINIENLIKEKSMSCKKTEIKENLEFSKIKEQFKPNKKKFVVNRKLISRPNFNIPFIPIQHNDDSEVKNSFKSGVYILLLCL